MYKIKKRGAASPKPPVLYDVVEDYTEFDAPGNVTACAMTQPENVSAHARILSESYQIPIEIMTDLLTNGGIYVYPASGSLVTRCLFACRIDPAGAVPKQTWVLNVTQYAEAEQLARSYGLTLEEAAARVFDRTLPPELKEKIQDGTLGRDKSTGPKGGKTPGAPIQYIDFRKDWSPHFKRLCIMPDGRMMETGGLEEFASLHGITVEQSRTLLEQGGTLEADGEILACQIVNGQPSVARFNRAQYAKALVESKGLHLMDALSEVGLNDPGMMRALRRLEPRGKT